MSARKAEGHKVKTLTLKYYWNYISMFLKNSNEKKNCGDIFKNDFRFDYVGFL